jgi:hypothetical protein
LFAGHAALTGIAQAGAVHQVVGRLRDGTPVLVPAALRGRGPDRGYPATVPGTRWRSPHRVVAGWPDRVVGR